MFCPKLALLLLQLLLLNLDRRPFVAVLFTARPRRILLDVSDGKEILALVLPRPAWTWAT